MATTARDSASPAGSMRRDAWWVQPLITFLVLTGFIIYATFRTFENAYFTTLPLGEPHQLNVGMELYRQGRVGDLLSPFYSPLFAIDWRLLGYYVSPALLILPFPLSFRLTCYYYRKAYYRSFFWSPPACAVKGAGRPGYTGERKFPFILQNLHRFTFYFAFIFIFILAYDIIKSMHYVDGWGFSLATIVFFLNVFFLCMYTFGCHSWRHLVGGGLDCFSCDRMSKTRHGLWKKFSVLNNNHALWAWVSLFGVALTDLYVRLVTSGAITDPIFFRF